MYKLTILMLFECEILSVSERRTHIEDVWERNY
jgi:hypothetical protein